MKDLYFKLISQRSNPKGYVFSAIADDIKKYLYTKFVN